MRFPFLQEVGVKKGIEVIFLSPRIGNLPGDTMDAITEILLTRDDKAILEHCCKVTGRTKTEIVCESINMIYENLNKSDKK